MSFSSFRKNLLRFGLMAIIILMPYPVRYFNIGLYIFLIGFFIHPDVLKMIRQSLNQRQTYILGSLFILISIGHLYTIEENPNYGNLSLAVSFLLVPFFINGIKLSNQQINEYLRFFVFSCFSAAFICISYALYRNFFEEQQLTYSNWGSVDAGKFNEEYKNSLINWNLFTYREFSKAIDIHPVYLSIYFIFGIIILIHRLISGIVKSKISTCFFLIFLGISVLLIGAKAPILSMVVVLVAFTGYQVTKSGQSKRYLIRSAIVLTAFVILIFTVPGSKFRINGFIKSLSDLQNIPRNETQLLTNGTKHRIYIWSESIKLAKKSPLYGYGTEGDRVALIGAYEKDGFKVFYNEHNQYLKYLLSYGIFGLLLFIAVFVYQLSIAWKKSNLIYVMLILLLLLSFLTENILSTQKGVIFYTFMSALLFRLSRSEDQGKIVM